MLHLFLRIFFLLIVPSAIFFIGIIMGETQNDPAKLVPSNSAPPPSPTKYSEPTDLHHLYILINDPLFEL